MANEISNMGELDHGLPGWIITGIITIIGAMSSAVVFLFRWSIGQAAARIEETQKTHTKAIAGLEDSCGQFKTMAEDCQKDREELRVEIAEVRTRLDIMTETTDE